MHENMNRVESAVTATASGDLTWEHWTHDCATALGFAGQRNPLGFAVVRYLSDAPTSTATWGIVLHLATALEKRGHVADLASKAAWVALDVWNNIRCPQCMGRGVTDFEQTTCGLCHGTGSKDLGSLAEIVRDGISALMEAERWMEGQLAARLRK